MRAAPLALAALLALAAAALASPGAAADHCWAEVPPCGWYPGDALGPNPLCGAVPSLYACVWPWFNVAHENAGCVLGADAMACLETSCTLDNPPSRCGNALVQAGFKR